MITTIYAARAFLVGGSIHDLVFFSEEFDAVDYKRMLMPLPLGFEKIEVVPIDVIGATSLLPHPRLRRDAARRAA